MNLLFGVALILKTVIGGVIIILLAMVPTCLILPVLSKIVCRLQTQIVKKDILYKELQKYTTAKNSKVVLYISGNRRTYQGEAIGKTSIRISTSLYKHVKEHPEHIEYIKTTICHELAHIELRHLGFQGRIKQYWYTFWPIKDKYLISSWLDEFQADYYGCKIYGNKDIFLDKMRFMKENTSFKHEENPKAEHPTWDMRITHIMDDITPTLQRTEREYKKFYGIKR